jgi:hypothetical protein
MTTLQKTLVSASVVAIAGFGIYETRQASNLKNEVSMLRQQSTPSTEQIRRLQEERDRVMDQLSALTDDLERAKRESADALKLREELTRLQREAATATAELNAAKKFKLRVMQIYSNSPPVGTFTSTTSTTVSWGQAIVTGGWKTPEGKRAIVLVALQPGDDPRLVILYSTILEFTEDAGTALGLARFNTDGQRTTKAQTLTTDQYQALMKSVKGYEGVKIVAEPLVQTVSGQQAEIQVVSTDHTPTGEANPAGTVVNLIPTIFPDGQSVQMVIGAQLNYPIEVPTE